MKRGLRKVIGELQQELAVRKEAVSAFTDDDAMLRKRMEGSADAYGACIRLLERRLQTHTLLDFLFDYFHYRFKSPRR
jgi:hypothetical protein